MSVVLSSLRLTCSITPYTAGKSTATGEPTTVAGSAVTGVACAIQPATSEELAMFGRDKTAKTILAGYFPAGTVIDERSRVTPDTGQYASVVLSAIGPAIDVGGLGDHLVVPLRRYEGGPDT